MITCQSCNSEVPENNLFCTKCGTRIVKEALDSHVESATEALQSPGKETSTASEASKLKSLQKMKAELEKELVDIEKKIDEREGFSASLNSWYNTNTSSYLWRTFSTMKSNLDQTEEVLSHYESVVDGLEIPDPGVMHSLRKTFHRRLLASFTIFPAIMAFFLWIPTLITKITGQPGLVQFLTGLLISPWKIYTAGITAIFTTLVLELISYYRGWSTYQARVNKTLWELEEVAQSAAFVRSEQLRLKSVYPQLREWLEIMGHSLTRPWTVNKKWSESSSANIEQDSLPYSMHIAQTDESDGPAMLGMQRYAAERFMVRGWRSRVFAEQVDTIREQLGLNTERLNVDLLDSDIAYAPNGPRSMVRGGIADPKVLEKVAFKQIEPLTLQIQKEAIANTRPAVHEVKSAQADALSGGTSGSDYKEVAWDDFLTMPLGDSSKMVSPFALHSLSDSGQVFGHQSRADSFFIVPQRLESKVTHAKAQNIRTYGESSNLPMDIVVRLDFTGPIPGENLTLLANAVKKSEAKPSSDEEIVSKKPRESGI